MCGNEGTRGSGKRHDMPTTLLESYTSRNMQAAEKNNNMADTNLNVQLGFYEWKRENIRKAREKRIQEIKSTLPTLYETTGYSRWGLKPSQNEVNLIPQLHLGSVSRENLEMTIKSFKDTSELNFPLKLRTHSKSHIDWNFDVNAMDRFSFAESSNGIVSDVDFQRYRIELLKAVHRREIEMYRRPPSALSLLSNHSSLVLGPHRRMGHGNRETYTRGTQSKRWSRQNLKMD